MEVLEQLWDKAPDWKKKDIAAQIRATVEEYQREQEAGVTGAREDEGWGIGQREDGGQLTGEGEDEDSDTD
jgi:hypothetical protein